MLNPQPLSTLETVSQDVFGEITGFLDNTNILQMKPVSKIMRDYVHNNIYREQYQRVLSSWTQLLSKDIKPKDYKKLKTLAVSLYEKGLFRRIVGDLDKVNLKEVIVSALLENYVFEPEHHSTLELVSHLLFFNKNSKILFAQDGDKREKFPSFAQLPEVLERYAKKTERDCFYLLFTNSAQVVYYNKLTNEARVFLCAHAGWGINECPEDHIFSVLLFRRIGHVDCLVDVPDIKLPKNINLGDKIVLNEAIQSGALLLSFYRAYIQKNVDNQCEMHNFERSTGYRGYYQKNNGEQRERGLERFVDYLQETLFPLVDNNIYNAQVEDRTAITMPVFACIEQLNAHDNITYTGGYYQLLGRGLTIFPHDHTSGANILKALGFSINAERPPISDNLMRNSMSISKVIAHRYYSHQYIEVSSKEQLIDFLRSQAEKLGYVDYGENILNRLDYAYLSDILMQGEIGNFKQLMVWLEHAYGSSHDYAALRTTLVDICTRVKPWAEQSELLNQNQYPDESSFEKALEHEKNLVLAMIKDVKCIEHESLGLLEHFSKALQDDDDVVKALAKIDLNEFKYASDRLKKNIDFLVIITKIKKYFPMHIMPETMRDNRRAMLKILEVTDYAYLGITFAGASARLKACPWFVLAAIRQAMITHGSSYFMQYASSALRSDKVFVMQVLAISGFELQDVDARFTLDKACVITAVKQCGEPALRAAHKALQKEWGLFITAILYPTNSQSVLLGLSVCLATMGYALMAVEKSSIIKAVASGVAAGALVGRSFFMLNTKNDNAYLERNFQEDELNIERTAEQKAPML